MRKLESAPALIGRQAAHSAGLVRYFTGRPCINGHTVQRYVTTGACIACSRDSQRSFARGKNGAYVWVKVRVHKADAEAIQLTATMLNAQRDAKAAALDAATDWDAVRESLKHKHSGKEAPLSKPSGKFSD